MGRVLADLCVTVRARAWCAGCCTFGIERGAFGGADRGAFGASEVGSTYGSGIRMASSPSSPTMRPWVPPSPSPYEKCCM